jgi:hypothetical protein
VTCLSSNRCCSTSCDTCRWRYSGRIARRTLPDGRLFFKVEIELGKTSFRSWASSARNVIEYRRSQSRWWNDVILNVWLCRDQRVRGILALGSVRETEFLKSFERWPTTLGPVAPENVRAEVYRSLHPARIAIVPNGRRYQSISFSVGPRRLSAVSPATDREPRSVPIEVAPLPCIF